MSMCVNSFFDKQTFTVTYVVGDTDRKVCAVIDPVLDFDQASGRTSRASADRVIDYIKQQEFALELILETHAHADHLSGGPYIKSQLTGKVAIGEHIADVQKIFKDIFNLESDFGVRGQQFDILFKDGDTFSIGSLNARVMHTPGHTPACLTYVIEDTAFVGDTLFQPDYGSARADFPGGDARKLYQSMRKILSLPEDTRIFTCHDYLAEGRDHFEWESTVRQQREQNIHIHDGVSEDEFVAMRTARDKTLDMPQLILPSVQVNIRAGVLPPPEDNGVSYLKLPVDAL
jgi:glyoxylase-like metal-dependent hydrolase (beta-lactamase superfamily II)